MRETTDRPVIKPELSLFEKVLQILCAVIAAAALVMLIISWNRLPVSVPMHFSFSGIPDSYRAKSNIIFFPFFIIGLDILLTFLEQFPHIYNYPVDITEKTASAIYQTGREMITCIKTETTAVFAFLLTSVIQTAKGVWNRIPGYILVIVIALLLLTLAFYILKMLRLEDSNEQN